MSIEEMQRKDKYQGTYQLSFILNLKRLLYSAASPCLQVRCKIEICRSQAANDFSTA